MTLPSLFHSTAWTTPPPNAESRYLPFVVDADGYTNYKTWQSSQIDDAPVAAPLGGVTHAAEIAASHRLPGVIDAEGPALSGARQAP
jgi:hypothetical protein